MLPRHVLDYEDVIRALWLDHSGSMTATDLSRHLVASCPSFYLRPRYTMQRQRWISLPEWHESIASFESIVCVLYIAVRMYSCIYVYTASRYLSSRTFWIYSVHRVALDIKCFREIREQMQRCFFKLCCTNTCTLYIRIKFKYSRNKLSP